MTYSGIHFLLILQKVFALFVIYILISKKGIANNYNANLELNYGSSERNGESQTSYNQIYNAFAQKYFFPYLVGRSSFRYTRQSTETDSLYNAVSSFQPVGELTLNNSWFSLGGFGQRRILENNGTVPDFVRDDGGIHFKSKFAEFNLPSIGFRYNIGQNFTPNDINIRNNFEERKNANISYNFSNSSAFYNFNSNKFVNRNADVVHLNNSNRLMFSNRYQLFKNKYHINSNYIINYSTSEYFLPDTLNSQFRLPAKAGFFSVDFSPNLGKMDSLSSLIDGDLSSRSSEAATIGLNSRFANFALELSQEELVDGIFIYSDSIPFEAGQWEAYFSDDLFFSEEMTWEKITDTQPAIYDLNLFRIAIHFGRKEGRFFKAVNISNSDTGAIYITEIEAFRTNSSNKNNEQINSSQSISVNNSFNINKYFETSLDMVYQNEPFSNSSSKKKNNVYSTFSIKNNMTRDITNTIRFQSEHQNLGYRLNTTDNRLINLGTRFNLTKGAAASLGVTNQWSQIDGDLIQENKNAIFQIRGKLLRVLNISTELGYSIVNQNIYDVENENWNYQLSLNGDVTRRINGYVSYGYKLSRDSKTQKYIERHILNMNSNWRLTNKIFISTRHVIQEESNVNYSQFVNGNWAVIPKLNIGIQITNFYNENQFESMRYNIYSNLRMFKKGNLFFRFDTYNSESLNEINSNLEQESYSYQVGFRMGI